MSDSRRTLPSVTALLADAEAAGLMQVSPRSVVVDEVRALLDQARTDGGVGPASGWLAELTRRLKGREQRSLTRVINATGVVLHTNLGRAPLARAAIEAMIDAAGYSTLEFDVAEGERGSRQDHTRSLLTEVTGAESAYVVNNAASAVYLALNTFAEGAECVVSRGELVEIGGGFRIPEILAKSRATLVEVGTTNRTHAADYEKALTPETRLLLKVHRSNFKQSGFVSEVELPALVALGKARGVTVVHDIGSGLLIDLAEFGLTGEPMVKESVAAGALTVFSGDKLLGGPQAGIIVGPAALIDRIAKNPLARALRPDKVTIAGLEATLALYRDRAVALKEIPVLAMLSAVSKELQARAKKLAKKIPGATVEAGQSQVGGGAFPEAELPTWLVTFAPKSVDACLKALRSH
ncbi:MAG TPA: L-seryl-tRNA(Sec) selenium transferase, partial [Gemmatimonadales bacterium]